MACSNKYVVIIHFMILVVNIVFGSKKRGCRIKTASPAFWATSPNKGGYSSVGGLYFGDMGLVWGVRFFMRPSWSLLSEK